MTASTLLVSVAVGACLISGPVSAADTHGFPVPDGALEITENDTGTPTADAFSFRSDESVHDVLEFYRTWLLAHAWQPVNRTESATQTLELGQMTWIEPEEYQSVLVSGQLQSSDSPRYVFNILHVSDTKGFRRYAEQRYAAAEAGKTDASTPVTPVPVEGYGAWAARLDAITALINADDIDGLYAMSSQWFRRSNSDDYVRRKVHGLSVKELSLLFSDTRPELAMLIVRYEVRGLQENQLGYRAMYFDREGEEWKFDTLPMLELDAVPPWMHDRFTRNLLDEAAP